MSFHIMDLISSLITIVIAFCREEGRFQGNICGHDVVKNRYDKVV